MYCKPNKDSLSQSVIAIRCGFLSTFFFRENRALGFLLNAQQKNNGYMGFS